MQKIININYQGKFFPIEEQAHQTFVQYEQELQAYFEKLPDGSEIFIDIKNRITEIFLSKMSTGKTFLDTNDIQDIIQLLGRPTEFDDDNTDTATDNTAAHLDTEDQTSESNTFIPKEKRRFGKNPHDKILFGVGSGLAAYLVIDPVIIRIVWVFLTLFNFPLGVGLYILLAIILPSISYQSHYQKRFYRDQDDKIVGGVCAGFAKFFNTESYVFRLLFVGLILLNISTSVLDFYESVFDMSLGGTVLLLYLLLWILTPYAKTPIEKKLLKGEPINIKSLKPEDYAQVQITNNVRNQNISKTIKTLLIIACIFILTIFTIPTLFGLGVSQFVLGDVLNIIWESNTQKYLVNIALGGIAIIPLLMLGLLIFKLFRGPKIRIYGFMGIGIILWILCSILLGVMISQVVNNNKETQTYVQTYNVQAVNDTITIHSDGPIEIDLKKHRLNFPRDFKDINKFNDFISKKNGQIEMTSQLFEVHHKADSIAKLKVHMTAQGKSKQAAQKHAQASVLTFHETAPGTYFIASKIKTPEEHFHFQRATVELHVPKSTVVRCKNVILWNDDAPLEYDQEGYILITSKNNPTLNQLNDDAYDDIED